MSQENVELRALAEAGYGALNSGDLDAVLALTPEDVEFTSLVAEVEGTTFRGHEGVRTWWETVRSAFANVRWQVLEVRRFGDRGARTVGRERRSATVAPRRSRRAAIAQD